MGSATGVGRMGEDSQGVELPSLRVGGSGGENRSAPLAGGADKSPGALSRTHCSALKKRWGRYQPIIPDTQSLMGSADGCGRRGGRGVGRGAWGGAAGVGESWHNLEITHVDSANSIKCKRERERERESGGIIWEGKIAAVTRRLSFGSFNSIEMAAAQLRGTEPPVEEGGGREVYGGGEEPGPPHPDPPGLHSNGS